MGWKTRIRLPLLGLVVLSAALVWWLDRQPSSAVRQAATADSDDAELVPKVAPRTALEEHVQQARAYARQLLPRSGNTRYPSPDDYLWIEVKDCYRDRADMMAHIASGYDLHASERDAFIALLLDGSDANAEQAVQRWSDSATVAWSAAMACERDCSNALARARHPAEIDPHNTAA